MVETLLHSSHKKKTMNTFDLGFPPVDALLGQLSKIEYKKRAKQFVNASITILVWTAAIITILIAKYQEHNGSVRLHQAWQNLVWQNLVVGVMISYKWVIGTLVPECKAMYNHIISIKNVMMLVTL